MPAGRPKDHIVESQGVVYRVGRNNFKNWLRAKAKGDSPTLGAFGARVVTAIDRNVSDYSQEEAMAELDKYEDTAAMIEPEPEIVADF